MPKLRKRVDKQLLKELCLAQLTNDEISRCLRVSWDTLDRRYAEAIKAWRIQGPGSVRRRLYQTAMSEDKSKVTAMIFFLKNYGGMSDRYEHSGPNGQPIQIQSLEHLTDEQVREIEALIETAHAGTNQG